MTPKIHLVRHAEAEHNVEEDYSILDAPLTQLGREQAAKLNKDTVQNIQQTAELLIASPLTRTLQTAILGFPVLIARLEAAGGPKKGIVVQSRLQETSSKPCDTGRPREELVNVEEFVGIDFSSLEDDWHKKEGEFHPERVTERAKWVRKWLRDRSEKEIVVVAHGGILRRIIKAPTGPDREEWPNCEVRQYKFKSTDDEEADLIPAPTKEAVGTAEPASSELAQVQ